MAFHAKMLVLYVLFALSLGIGVSVLGTVMHCSVDPSSRFISCMTQELHIW